MVEAYTHGSPWLEALKTYLQKNYQTVQSYIDSELPMLKLSPLEATYLLWIDLRALNMQDQELKNFIIQKAGLGLNDGPVFGPGGSGFQRMNIACPQQELLKALEKLKKAILY
jgi:cystathionine beta-lyase